MTGEVLAGRTTLIEHNGNEFELPDRHKIELQEAPDGETWVSISTPQSGSLFAVRELEDRDGAVVVHLADEKGRHGPPGFSEPLGYPFL
jgi:hypothetical protein